MVFRLTALSVALAVGLGGCTTLPVYDPVLPPLPRGVVAGGCAVHDGRWRTVAGAGVAAGRAAAGGGAGVARVQRQPGCVGAAGAGVPGFGGRGVRAGPARVRCRAGTGALARGGRARGGCGEPVAATPRAISRRSALCDGGEHGRCRADASGDPGRCAAGGRLDPAVAGGVGARADGGRAAKWAVAGVAHAAGAERDRG